MKTETVLKVSAILGFVIGMAAGFVSISPIKQEIEEQKKMSKVVLPPELKNRKPHPLSPSEIAAKTKVKDVGARSGEESGTGKGESTVGSSSTGPTTGPG
ncbi:MULTISPECIES: hypothetical protein [unclassified Methanopyrus]|uniref:hypothetical protein n=1 Tax=unclassified Methanopyrus TaxID=2684913 RepID=UPI000B4AD7D1|nr:MULTISPECIES: hypothetical protein [unclassified Methanopyrus]